ncbi:MAG: ion transporter [Chloroflexota bacterium]
MADNEKASDSKYQPRPGDRVVHIRPKSPRRRLRVVPHIPGLFRFLLDIIHETPLLPLLFVLTMLWLLFSLAIYLAEGPVNEQFHSYWYTLWWSFTAMQTQGANSPGPVHPLGMIVGGIWSVIGTIIFFGVIIATVYSYYMIPKRRRSKVIVDALQYNLNEIEYLSIEELTALRDTVTNMVNARISYIEKDAQNQS